VLQKKPQGLNSEPRNSKIIVTLTSYPARIRTLYKVLVRIFEQTVKPDKVLLWLAEDQFPQKEKKLPRDLLKLKKMGLDIRWCDDLRPHKKYYYTMQEFPDDIVITIDDDIVYRSDMVEVLMRSYQKNPKAVSALRAHKMLFDDEGSIRPYKEWIMEYPAPLMTPRMDLVATGAGGVLYPPHCMHKELFNKEVIIKSCLHADDMWLKVMQMMAGTPTALADKQLPLKYVHGTQESALWRSNVDNDENDEQLQNIFKEYNKLLNDMTTIPTINYAGRKTGLPKVSIIMPVYNVQKYLRECLDSVVSQTLKDIEIICVNDGSTDNSLEILKEYAAKDSRIIIIDKPNSGYGHSMNIGMDRATGEYVGIVETDDLIKSEMYETLYNIAVEKDLDIIKADYFNFYGDADNRQTKYIRIAGKAPEYYGKVLNTLEDITPFYFTLNTWSGIYKRQFLDNHSIRHNETPGASYQDSGFWFQTLAWARRLYFINRPFYMYRQDNPNSSVNNKAKVYCVCDEYEFIMDFMNRNTELKDKFIYIYSYRRYYSYMFVLKRIGQQFKFEFILRFSADFRKLKDDNCLDPSLFTKGEWNQLLQIIKDPEEFYLSNYYPPFVKLREAQRQLNDIRRSKSFKIGRFITWLPRKIRGVLRRVKDYTKKVIRSIKRNGWKFTCDLIKLKIKNKFKKKRITPNAKLKILFIASDNYRISGAFLSMTNLCRILKNDFGVYTYVILPKGGNGDGLLKEAGIGHHIIKSYDWIVPLDQKRDIKTRLKMARNFIRNRFAAIKIAKFAKNERFHIIHINTTYSYVGAIAAKKVKVPCVWHLREFLEEDQGKTIWNRKKGYRLINESSRIIAISQSIFDKYNPIFEQGRLKLVYNGIDENIFYKPDKMIFKEDKAIFIFIGNFAYHKGHMEFARACVSVAQQGFVDFEIWFVGSGNAIVQKEVEEYFKIHGQEGRIKMLGYAKNVADYYSQADISFTCSKSEAFGRVTVEAMLSGNLVIGADVGGTKELVIHGDTGLLYHQGDSEHLAKTIIYALTHKEEMSLIANRGRKHMHETMTARINANNILNVYKEILK